MNGNIQFRSTVTNNQTYSGVYSGVVSTLSGGYVTKVVITFSTETATGRTLDVYGNSSAYSTPNDLYSNGAKSSNAGTKIGSIQYEGTKEVELNASGSYQYVGLRSNSGAIYIEKIEIYWTSLTEVSGVNAIQVSSLPTTSTYAIGEKFSSAGLVVQVQFVGSNTFENTTNYSLSIADGYTFTSSDRDGNGQCTVTVTSGQDNTKTTTFKLTLNSAYPVALDKSTPIVFSSNMKLNEGTGRFTAEYSDASFNVTNIKIGDSGTTLKTAGENPVTITPSSANAIDYAGDELVLEYTDQGHTVSYSFVVTIEDDLTVDHFDDVPDYIIKNTESSIILAHYVSFTGTQPNISITTDSDSGLTISRKTSMDSYDSVTKVGSIYFTLTGSKKGQYSIVVTISLGGENSSKSLSILVRDAEEGHEGSGTYTLMNSSDEITSGKYVIAANVSGTYHALNGVLGSNNKYGNDVITVSDGVITSSTYHPITINVVDGGYNIINTSGDDSYYVGHVTGNTNMSESSTAFTWLIETASSHGTFLIKDTVSGENTTTRGLIYRAGNINSFGAYAISNPNSADSEYYNVELFKYINNNQQEEVENEAFELVKTFVNQYMHMNDISTSNEDDTGACLGSNGYYLTAKAGWNTMVTNYSGSASTLEEIFQEKFPDAYARYMAWASRNGDTAPFTGTTIVTASSNGPFSNITSNNAITIVVIVISMMTITMVGAYLTLRKKKEVK